MNEKWYLMGSGCYIGIGKQKRYFHEKYFVPNNLPYFTHLCHIKHVY
jgi:hypothetical protein